MKSKTIEDWNYILRIWFSGYLNIVSVERRNEISPKSHLRKVKKIFKEFIGNIFRGFIRETIPENQIWFLSLSKNNYESFKHIQKTVDNSIIVSFHSLKEKALPNVHTFSLKRRFIYNIFFPFKFLTYFIKTPKKTTSYYDLFFQCYGTNQECLRLINRYKPKAIVFANDHVIISRSMLMSAKKIGVKTYYIQHAAVSNYFPPLDFDYAFLEGQDSLNKYSKSGLVNSQVFLTGMSKFDVYAESINKNNRLKVLGIAYNSMDDIMEIETLLSYLINAFPGLQIVIRPHPSDKRKVTIKNIEISDPKKENSFEFLSKIDVIISGNSSIHLEAVLLNVFSIQYNFSNNPLDYYGFIENGLVIFCKTLEDLKEQINMLRNQKPSVQKKAKFYNAAIESDFYGDSSGKIVEILNKTINT
ncbi:hypothetical protein KO506_05910 [Polaribacter vadi]|uniref:hypothetical protein n=1 Tax=Polaribacter TaxID=52959 RepID=UPI001C086DAC|nr:MULTISPECIES: hypothetical protein [Polaribacter]MBU3010928.1 hypothetical protein [Polaribacter vadi]MDO6740740.1 hypothetical protein [Polaribacter sp. 1_MG-2023]